jgi:orotate phosphoribosyltransferase
MHSIVLKECFRICFLCFKSQHVCLLLQHNRAKQYKAIIVSHLLQKQLKMKTLEKSVAEKLLKIKAVKLQPNNPFVWASGWNSPIYCDNRKTLSYPQIRNFIKIELARLILELYPEAEVIAGVATGAIAQGALVADELGLPFVYVRPTPKDHGLENMIEGDLRPRQKVVVIEDLISTGGSSLKAVEAIRNDGSEVLGMLAIFSYGFPVAEEKFKKAKVKLTTLCGYDSVLAEALATNYIAAEDIETLQEWRQSPSTWKVD